MGRRRLAIATWFAENAAILSITILVALGLLFISAILVIASFYPDARHEGLIPRARVRALAAAVHGVCRTAIEACGEGHIAIAPISIARDDTAALYACR